MLSSASIPGGVWVKSMAGLTWFCDQNKTFDRVNASADFTLWFLPQDQSIARQTPSNRVAWHFLSPCMPACRGRSEASLQVRQDQLCTWGLGISAEGQNTGLLLDVWPCRNNVKALLLTAELRRDQRRLGRETPAGATPLPLPFLPELSRLQVWGFGTAAMPMGSTNCPEWQSPGLRAQTLDQIHLPTQEVFWPCGLHTQCWEPGKLNYSDEYTQQIFHVLRVTR